MKILFTTTVMIVLLALAGCGNEDWMRPSGPQGDSTMKTVALPGGGKMVRQEVGEEIRVTIFDKYGNILAKDVNDSRGDLQYRNVGAPSSPRAMPERHHSVPERQTSPPVASVRNPSCNPCQHGYTHRPRPGYPCGCGR